MLIYGILVVVMLSRDSYGMCWVGCVFDVGS